jgi:hypothetical protein
LRKVRNCNEVKANKPDLTSPVFAVQPNKNNMNTEVYKSDKKQVGKKFARFIANKVRNTRRNKNRNEISKRVVLDRSKQSEEPIKRVFLAGISNTCDMYGNQEVTFVYKKM